MPIYTKKGDKGETSLLDGKKVSKDSWYTHAIGTVDELNCQIGKTVATIERDSQLIEYVDFLRLIQTDLFCIGSTLAGKEGMIKELDGRIAVFEGVIDTLTEALPELKNFILPGGTILASEMHLCRTISRRAERNVATGVFIDDVIKRYLNRLSDLFFMLSRAANHNAQMEDIVWKT